MAIPVLSPARWEENLRRHLTPFAPLPSEYRDLPKEEIRARTARAKEALGESTVILGHNYQSDEIVEFSDFVGDSYGLSVAASKTRAKYIVFCGVTFMAETAEILTGGERFVLIPSMEASCPMAGMAEMVQVQKAFDLLETLLGPDSVVPVTYMNSYADLKAFTGAKGGIICTSSNALKALDWALSTGKKVLFLPDKNLGENLSRRRGLSGSDLVHWNPWERELGGTTVEELERARVILWEGWCQVHDRFRIRHVEEIRRLHPEAKILVHPEVPREVFEAADAWGSTTEMSAIVRNSPPGTTWAVATEIHMVRRLAKENPDKKIFPLCGELCLDCNAMRQIDPAYLLWVLEELAYRGRPVNRITVAPEERELALLALQRMLSL